MANRQTLVAVSAGQLAAGLVGQVVALRRRRPYDTPLKSGRPEAVGRDSWTQGTAFSAPVVMLVVQAWATARLRSAPSDGARRALGGLGAVMTVGYLLERLDRHRLTPRGVDPVETPIVMAGLAGAIAMAALGHRDQAGR